MQVEVALMMDSGVQNPTNPVNSQRLKPSYICAQHVSLVLTLALGFYIERKVLVAHC